LDGGVIISFFVRGIGFSFIRCDEVDDDIFIYSMRLLSVQIEVVLPRNDVLKLWS
jgi:hypothetical protein